MKKNIIKIGACITLFIATLPAAIAATPVNTVVADRGTTLTTTYVHSDVIDKDGLGVSGAIYKTGDMSVSLNAFGDIKEGDLYTFGGQVGIEAPVTRNVSVTPALGVQRYRDADVTALTAGADAKLKINPNFFVTAGARYDHGLGSDGDDLNGVVYNTGVGFRF